MLKYIFSSRYVLLLIAFSFIQSGCRKKIDFTVEETSESGTLHPLQQYYAPWETVSISTNGNTYMIESDNNYLYTVSNNGTRRWVEYMGTNHIVQSIFYSEVYQFTALEKGVNRMIVGASGGTIGLATFNQSGIISTYSFYIPTGKRINAIYDDAISFYSGGNFNSFGLNPASDYVDRVISSTGSVQGCPGIVSEVYDVDRIAFSPYACGNAIIPSGHSIAMWNGISWDPHTSIMNEKVTDMQMIGDTLFVAGFSPGDFAIKKYSNGTLITDSTMINTATSTDDTDIKLLTYNGKLYAYGTINFTQRLYLGVVSYTNGEWSYVGKLATIPEDVAIYNGHLYALTNGVLKRFPL